LGQAIIPIVRFGIRRPREPFTTEDLLDRMKQPFETSCDSKHSA
jgi:hypothetical protein